MRNISIAMATYNGERFLAAQLESLARQTLRPSELMICDDGSTDRTLVIAEQFAATAPFPVSIVRNEDRLGYGNNFLKSASLATGDLIAFSDQDDVWCEAKLERCASVFNDPEILLCVHSGELWDGQKSLNAKVPEYNKRQDCPPGTLYPLQGSLGLAMVLRRDLLTIADPETRPTTGHDQWLWFLASVFGKVALLPDVLLKYRQHGDNVFGATPVKKGAIFASALKRRDYLSRAVMEDQASEYLTSMSSEVASERRSAARAGAQHLKRCAKLNRLRHTVYQGPFVNRIRAYLRVFSLGGYTDPGLRSNGVAKPPSAPRWRAPIKDLVLGVFGLSRVSEPVVRALARLRRLAAARKTDVIQRT